MLVVVGIMLVGVLLGYLMRGFELKHLSSLITLAIILLLFLLGAAVGGNATIMNSLGTIGAKALVMGSAGVLGSVCVAKAIGKWIKPPVEHNATQGEKQQHEP